MTSSQRQWLRGFIAQMVKASHRCREVTTPLKSWLSQASIRNCLNCVRNCDYHSSLDFKSAVQYMKHFIDHFTVYFCCIFIKVYLCIHFCSKFSVPWKFDWMCLFVFKIDPLLFTAEEITGKTLFSIEKSDLKELGINTLGRRLEVYEKVKHYCSCTVCILKIRDDDNKNSKKFIKSESSTLLIIQLRNLWPCTIILQLCCMNMRHLFT